MRQQLEPLNSEVVGQLVLLTEAVGQLARSATLMNELSAAWVSYVTTLEGVLRAEAEVRESPLSIADHLSPIAGGQRRIAELLLDMKSTMELSFALVARKFAVPHDVRSSLERSMDLTGVQPRDDRVADFARERLFRMPAMDALRELAGQIAAASVQMQAVNADLAAHMGRGSRHLRACFGSER